MRLKQDFYLDQQNLFHVDQESNKRLWETRKYNDLQCAKKAMSNSLGLEDFAIRLVNSVLNLSNWQVMFFLGNSNYKGTVVNPAHQFSFFFHFFIFHF